eukprot:scaffold22183_cov66-Phaeocystis_antarctica.AAC.1
MCCSLLLLENSAGLSPNAGTPLEKRSAGSHRAAVSWITLPEGSARGAPWASSALTASEVGGICDTSVVARLSPTRSRSSRSHAYSAQQLSAGRVEGRRMPRKGRMVGRSAGAEFTTLSALELRSVNSWPQLRETRAAPLSSR